MNSAPPALARLVSLVTLGRPLHLLGGTLFYLVGLAAAARQGAALGWPLAALGLATVLAAQLMTHYSNDFFDLPADRLNRSSTRWTGGSRVLPEGRLSAGVALWAAVVCGALALLLAGWAAARSQHPALAFGLAGGGAALAWSYSAPPLRLNWRGLGEIVGALAVPVFPLLFGYGLHAGTLTRLPLLLAAPLCMFAFGQLIMANVPDAAGDAAAGKRTLLLRLGTGRAGVLYMAVLACAYAIVPVLRWLGLPGPLALASLGGAPIALWLVNLVRRGVWLHPAYWDRLGFWSVGLLVGTALCQLVALIVS